MKALITGVALASTLFVSACDGPQPHASQPAAPGSAAASTAHDYRCESGETVVATYPDTDSATIRYKAATYDLRIAVSASGARYVGGELEWWTKGSGAGSEGTLFGHEADGTTGERLEYCTAQ